MKTAEEYKQERDEACARAKDYVRQLGRSLTRAEMVLVDKLVETLLGMAKASYEETKHTLEQMAKLAREYPLTAGESRGN